MLDSNAITWTYLLAPFGMFLFSMITMLARRDRDEKLKLATMPEKSDDRTKRNERLYRASIRITLLCSGFMTALSLSITSPVALASDRLSIPSFIRMDEVSL